jgi:hypothetical protein
MRGLAVTVAVALGVAASGFGFAQLARAMTYGPGAPSAWILTDSAGPTQADPAGDTPIGSFLAGGVKHIHRAYFSYDLTGLRGQALHEATLSSAETSVRDCGTASPVEVWRTGPITRDASWADPPAEVELLRAADLGPGAVCPGAYLGVDVLAPIQAALDRHEKSITFEVRVGAGAEEKILAGRLMRPLRLTVAANHVPEITVPGPQCGAPGSPVAAGGRSTLALRVTDGDGDQPAGVTFAVWPVDHPEKRRQFPGGGGLDPTGVIDLSGYPDGTVLAWAGQARDADDASAWSNPCYLTVDNTAPRTSPVVSSATCSDGQNVPGTFIFDAGGDRDTVAFAWSDDQAGRSGRIDARRPGGRARLSLAAELPGDDSLQVSAVDAAGNRGPAVAYDVCPGDLPGPDRAGLAGAPPGVASDSFAWDHDAVAGEPGTFTFTPHSDGVVAYLYDFGADDRQRVDAGADGTATLKWTPPRSGDFTMDVAAVTADGAISESARSTFYVVDVRPIVSAAAEPTGVGLPAHLTISSDLSGVRQYLYSFDGTPERPIPYAYQAAVQVVPAHAGANLVTVRSKLADGTLTPASTLTLAVSSAPRVEMVRVLGSPAIAGRIGSVKLVPGEAGVASYQYTFNGSDGEQTVAAGPDGTATVKFTPDQPGWRVLIAASVSRDGTVSDTRRYPVVVDDPRVQVAASWPATGTALGLGVPGTFQLLGDLAGQTSAYLWQVDGGPVQVVPRDPAAAYTRIPYTPGHTGPSTFSVQRKFEDGSLSPVTDYHFEVGTQPRVAADDPGPGTPGKVTTLTLSGGRPGVVSFDYQITGDSDGAVDAAGTVLTDDNGSSQVSFTPPDDGYQVIVTGHTADGTPTSTTTYALAAR